MTDNSYTLAEAKAHLASLSGLYASTVVGDCMEPLIRDGAIAVFDPQQWPKRGDLACIWVEGCNSKTGEVRLKALVKRVTQPGWGECALPYRLIGDSNVMPLIGFEALKPAREWCVEASRVHALHRFVGTAEDFGLVSNGNGLLVKAPARGKAVRHAA